MANRKENWPKPLNCAVVRLLTIKKVTWPVYSSFLCEQTKHRV